MRRNPRKHFEWGKHLIKKKKHLLWGNNKKKKKHFPLRTKESCFVDALCLTFSSQVNFLLLFLKRKKKGLLIRRPFRIPPFFERGNWELGIWNWGDEDVSLTSVYHTSAYSVRLRRNTVYSKIPLLPITGNQQTLFIIDGILL